MSTIPVVLTEEQFTTHLKPHLSVAKRGFASEHPLWKIFNLVLYVLHTGCQWSETPVPKDANDQPIILAGDRAALKHAVAEVILNALQANPADAQVEVCTKTDTDGSGSRWVHIDIQDHGSGFSTEAVQHVPEPFYTTRNVGLGLGLTVSRKIIETHQGKLSIASTQAGNSGTVRISLPLGSTLAEQVKDL